MTKQLRLSPEAARLRRQFLKERHPDILEAEERAQEKESQVETARRQASRRRRPGRKVRPAYETPEEALERKASEDRTERLKALHAAKRRVEISQGPRTPPKRGPLSERISVCVNQSMYEFVLRVGRGSMSEGVRYAIALVEGTLEDPPLPDPEDVKLLKEAGYE